MPSPPSTRPRGARGRRSFVFVREDGETATDSALLVGHHHRLDRRAPRAYVRKHRVHLIRHLATTHAITGPVLSTQSPTVSGTVGFVLAAPAEQWILRSARVPRGSAQCPVGE